MAAYRRVCDSLTCRLTAKNWDQLRNPTLRNRVRATFTFFIPPTTALGVVRLVTIVWLRYMHFYNGVWLVCAVTGSTGSPGRWIPVSLARWVTKCDPGARFSKLLKTILRRS